jgi:hypothetical protein
MATTSSAPPTFRRSEDEKRALLPRLECLSVELCQTTPYLIGALERAGLTVVLLEGAGAGQSEEAKGAKPMSDADRILFLEERATQLGNHRDLLQAQANEAAARIATLEARIAELERERDRARYERDSSDGAFRLAVIRADTMERETAVARADLDEAVGLLRTAGLRGEGGKLTWWGIKRHGDHDNPDDVTVWQCLNCGAHYPAGTQSADGLCSNDRCDSVVWRRWLARHPAKPGTDKEPT